MLYLPGSQFKKNRKNIAFVTPFGLYSPCTNLQKGDNKVSLIARVILTLMWVFMITITFVGVGHALDWYQTLTFLALSSLLVMSLHFYIHLMFWVRGWWSVFRYVKMFASFIKYVPQAYINFRRKSTVGWSIGLYPLCLLSCPQLFFLYLFSCCNAQETFSSISLVGRCPSFSKSSILFIRVSSTPGCRPRLCE